MMKLTRCLFVVLLAVVVSANDGDKEMSKVKATYTHISGQQFQLELKNEDSSPVTLLSWALGGAEATLSANLFEVTCDKSGPVPYKGIVAHRSLKKAEASADAITIAAGASSKKTFTLKDYDIPQGESCKLACPSVEGKGHFCNMVSVKPGTGGGLEVVDTRAAAMTPVAFGESGPPLLASSQSTKQLQLTKGKQSQRNLPGIKLPKGTPNLSTQHAAAAAAMVEEEEGTTAPTITFTNCDAACKTAAKKAAEDAIAKLGKAVTYLTPYTRDKAEFKTYFGHSRTEGDWNYAKTGMTKIKTMLSGSWKFNGNGPKCSPKTYAYVYPSDSSHTIYLCGLYHSAGATGQDSKMGILIHEASHFSDTRGTDDHYYGLSTIKKVATYSRFWFISRYWLLRTADTYEYFNEMGTF